MAAGQTTMAEGFGWGCGGEGLLGPDSIPPLSAFISVSSHITLGDPSHSPTSHPCVEETLIGLPSCVLEDKLPVAHHIAEGQYQQFSACHPCPCYHPGCSGFMLLSSGAVLLKLFLPLSSTSDSSVFLRLDV